MLNIRSDSPWWSPRQLRPLSWAAIAISSVVAGGLTTLGLKVSEDRSKRPPVGDFQLSDLLILAALSLGLFVLWTVVVLVLARCHPSPDPAPRARWWHWVVIGLGLVICWLPYYLAFFPGLLSPDSFNSLRQLQGFAPFSNHHPILYTLLVGAVTQPVLALGATMQSAVAWYTATQIVVMATVLAYAMRWLWVRTSRRWVIAAVGLVLALNPVMPLMAMTMWKDIPFALVFLLFSLRLYEAAETRGGSFRSLRWTAGFIVLGLLMGLLRNNAIYVLVVVLVVLVAMARRHWRRVLPAVLAILVVLPVLQGPVFRQLGFQPSNAAEALGVPLAQIGYTLNYGQPVSHDMSARIGLVLNVEDFRGAYRPHYVNRIKFHESFDNEYLNENTGDFLRVWAQMLPSNIVHYVKGYVALTEGYYTVGRTDYVYPMGIVPGSESARSGIDVASTPLLSGVSSVEGAIQVIDPWVNRLADIALAIGALVVVALVYIQRDQLRYLLWLLPAFGLWCTLLVAAPISGEFRYLWPVYLLVPFAVGVLFVADWAPERADELEPAHE